MPRYDYTCSACHETVEAVQGMEVSFISCPSCGQPAMRAAFSGVPAIKGDTVPKVCGQSSAITKHGYIDEGQALEAIADVHKEARKRGVEPPDLFREARRRVARGEVTESRLAH